jgi:hypothetical protein
MSTTSSVPFVTALLVTVDRAMLKSAAPGEDVGDVQLARRPATSKALVPSSASPRSGRPSPSSAACSSRHQRRPWPVDREVQAGHRRATTPSAIDSVAPPLTISMPVAAAACRPEHRPAGARALERVATFIAAQP